MSCRFAMTDAAYVIGALSPAERREYENHLDGCAECSSGVRDLAGLPGLLGRLDKDILDAPEPEPVPDTLLPNLVTAVRRHQRRRTWFVASGAAAAAAVMTVGTLAIVHQVDSPPTTVSSAQVTSVSRPMSPVGTEPMAASIALTRVAWGTRLDLTCSYPHPGGRYQPPATPYVLVVHTSDGRAQRVATWRGLPGGTMHLTAATAVLPGQITAVDLNHTDGTPVLQLTR